MKLLELHLRNIASIERADIDFEHDLIDSDTGMPAQRFLICGDTGSGKTVLLDGICLALFKTTPRLTGTRGRQHNAFQSNSMIGETNVFGIEQYSRLGIGAKDECYSEVLFVGNDGRHYRSRLELGVTRNGTYRVPRWTVQAGNDAEVSKECDRIIEQAIGMSFEQFKHVAMLAQGEFAKFLCGDRDERSKVLEKLTDTERFSNYGEAIHRIFARKKNDTLLARNLYNQSANSLVDAEEERRLRCRAILLKRCVARFAKRAAESDRHITLLEQLTAAIAAHNGAEKNLSTLQQAMQEPTFLQQQRLCSDWDATTEQRAMLKQFDDNIRMLEACNEEEITIHRRYDLLAADLLFRQDDLDRAKRQLDHEQQWLDERRIYDTLFTQASTAELLLQQYHTDIAKQKEYINERDKEQKRTTTLKDHLDRCNEKKQQVDNAVVALQRQLEEENRQLTDLHPDTVSEENKTLTNTEKAYERLSEDYIKLCNSQAALKKLEEDIQQLDKELAESRKQQTDIGNQQRAAKKIYEEALSRYTTLNASLEETLTQLRHNMAEYHIDHCPLCGQSLSEHLLDNDQFEALVSPLREEQEQARKAFEKADKELKNINEKLNQRQGYLEEKRGNANKQKCELDGMWSEMLERMTRADIDPQNDVNQSIHHHLEDLHHKQEALHQRETQISNIQKRISEYLEQQRKLNQDKEKYDQDANKAAKEFDENQNKIIRLAEQLNTLEIKLAEISKDLDYRLHQWHEAWRDDPENIRQKLKTDAKEYIERKESHEQTISQQKEAARIVEATRQHTQNLLNSHVSWVMPKLAKKHETDDLEKEWLQLSTDCTSLASRRETIQNAINECRDELNKRQRIDGRDMETLRTIAAKGNQIEDARKIVTDAQQDMIRYQQQLRDSLQHSNELRKQLKLDNGSPIPDIELLRRNLDTKRKKEAATRQRLADVQSRLHNADTQRRQHDTTLQALQTAEEEEQAWRRLDSYFGGDRFRNVVQTYILRPLLQNANNYLQHFSDRYTLTCSESNEQLAILVLDRFNRDELRSATVLSGGERFMISLALSLALSALVRSDMNVNLLFIDEGFGTLGPNSLDSVMNTLGRLSTIPGQGDRRVGMISHREELLDRIPNKIMLIPNGEGRSRVEVTR